MVIIVKKLVPIYKKTNGVPKRWKNLRKPKHVTSFKYAYPNIPKILKEQYGLKDTDKIIVYIMKEICLPHFKRYRTNFKKIYSGTLRDYAIYLREFMRSRSKKNKEVMKDERENKS